MFGENKVHPSGAPDEENPQQVGAEVVEEYVELAEDESLQIDEILNRLPKQTLLQKLISNINYQSIKGFFRWFLDSATLKFSVSVCLIIIRLCCQ